MKAEYLKKAEKTKIKLEASEEQNTAKADNSSLEDKFVTNKKSRLSRKLLFALLTEKEPNIIPATKTRKKSKCTE